MGKRIEDIEHVVLVCTGSDCRKKGSKQLFRTVRDWLRDGGRSETTRLVQMRCGELCERGPIVSLQPANIWITHATADVAVDVLERQIDGKNHAGTPDVR